MSSKNFYGLTGDVTIDGGILNVGNAQLYANTETSNVGIGTTNPGFALDVHGTANVGVLHSTFLYGDGSNIENIVSSQWEGSPGDPIYYASNIGISNTAPVTKTLQVGSNLYVEDAGSDVLYVTGNVTATRFIGDGSLLTGIAASLDQIVDQGNVVSNTIIIESGIDPVSNIGLVTREGVSISVSNSNPSGAFQFGVGSNLLVNVYSSNVLTVDGNIFAQKMTLGTVTVLPAYNLEQITGQGAVSVQTMSLTNATTGLTTTANIVVGGNVTATSVIITSNIEVGGNVNANTVITTANINIGRDLSVTGNVYIDNMRVADVASNLVTYDSTTGELMDSGGLISNKLAIVSEQPPSALTGASTTVTNHGVYTIEGSSIATDSELTYLFDKNNSTVWKTDNDPLKYDTTDGSYDGSEELATGIDGEWMKITMPYKTILRHIKFESTNSSIKDISIVGLNDDGTTWQTLKTVNGLNAVTSTIVVDASTYHKTYGIIIRATNSGKSQAEIGDLRLFTESLSVDGGAVTMPASVTLGNLATTGNVTASGTVKGVDLTGTNLYGTLSGSNAASVSSLTASGTVKGVDLIGTNLYGTLSGSNAASVSSLTASGTVKGVDLIGTNLYGTLSGSNAASVSSLTASGTVKGTDLIGTNLYGTLSGSNAASVSTLTASGTVKGTDLIGTNLYGTLSGSNAASVSTLTASGTVKGTDLIGTNLYGTLSGSNAASVSTLTASGTVKGTDLIGTNLYGTLLGSNAASVSSLTASGDVAVNTNTLFVDSSANSVGLGTVTPSANLHVTGNVYVSSNLEVGTANLFVDTVNSRVGIGTTAPESLLHLSASTASADITDPIKIKIHNRRGAGDWSITQPWGLLEFDTDDNGTAGTGPVAGIGCRFEGTSGGDSSICFYTDNIVNDDNVLGAANERMCINSDGNVGIGTNAPSNALHIRNAIPAVLLDDTDDDTKVRLTGGTGGDLYIDSNYGGSGSTGDIIFREASSEKMRITGAGNVGIGTNVPATALEVNGDIGIGRVAGGYTFREVVGGGVRATIKSNATNDLILSTGGDSEALRILTNGNVGIGKSDPTSLLHIYNEDTTAAGSTILSTIHGVFSGSDATGGNINNRGLLINLDSSATGGTTTSPQEHRLYGVDVDIDVTGDSDMITGGRFNINSDLAANGDDRTTHMYALDAMTRNNGSAPNSTMASLNARTLKASASGGLTDNMLGVRSEVEINAGSCTNAYGAQCIIDANHGSITNSYLYHGNYPTQGADTATITNKYGLYIAGADKNYITGNVGIGTNNPVGVNGGQRLEGSSSTGFEYIATRDDTAAVADDFVGAYLFKNTDTNGTEPHYAGMSSKMTGTNGPMDLRFHTNRDQYEGDTPQMIINSAGYVGIGTTDPKSIFHVGVGDADLRIGAVDYTGTSANTTTYGLERSRNQILFSTWRDAQTNKIGAKICGINKQTYSSPSLRHLIQSTDLAFYTVPPDSSDYDDTVERLRITDTGNVGIGTTSPGTKLDVNGTFSASGPTTGANHGSSSTLYLLDTCFFKEWEYINTVAPTAKVTFNTSTEIPDGAKAVLAEVYLGRDSLTTGDHQVHVLGKNHTSGQTAWRSGAGQPSTAFSADVDTRQTVDLLMPGESDGFTHHYGKWHSSVIIPLENNKIYYSNAGNSSSTGWVYVRIRGYYI